MNFKLKSHNSLRTNTLTRPLIRDGKIVIYDNTVQSQITFLLHLNTQVQVVWNLRILQHLLFLLLFTQSSLVHATGQAIPALLPNGATLPGCQASPSGVDIHQYQTPLNYSQQMFYQGAPGGLVVTGVSVFLDYVLTQRTLYAFFCLFIYFFLKERLSVRQD